MSAWIGAFLIAVLAGLVAWTIAAEAVAPPPERFVDFNQARIDAVRERSRASGSVVVVLLGSSAIKYATRDESALAAAIASQVHRPVDVLRIASNWGSFGDFVPLTPGLRDLNAGLFVIQRELLVTDRPRVRSFLLLIERIRYDLGLDSPLSGEMADEVSVQFEYPCWKRGVQRGVAEHMRHRDEWLVVRPDGPAAVAARRFVDELLAAGVTVALLEIPLRPDYDRVPERQRDKATTERQADALRDRVQHWNHAALDAALYCDVTHVTPAGQEVFSRWLESKVAETLVRPAARAASIPVLQPAAAAERLHAHPLFIAAHRLRWVRRRTRVHRIVSGPQ
jgi:hypothetical protein